MPPAIHSTTTQSAVGLIFSSSPSALLRIRGRPAASVPSSAALAVAKKSRRSGVFISVAYGSLLVNQLELGQHHDDPQQIVNSVNRRLRAHDGSGRAFFRCVGAA